MTRTGLRLTGAFVLLGWAWWPLGPLQAGQGPAAYRVFESASAGPVALAALAARIAQADVVFLGEHHDDAVAHRVERDLLVAVAGRRDGVLLALEMFDRDAQESLDHFQMGHTGEAEFLADARPWPRYVQDYKPIVDFAIARQWPVVAANVPRPMAADVAAGGLAALADRPDAERRLAAADLQCEASGDYFRRFVAALGTHGQTLAEAARVRYYEAQCLKDETMAESIAQAHAAASIGGRRPLVISVNGVVHSDFRLGTVERVERRLPGRDVVTVTFVPVASLDAGPDEGMRERADWVVLTLAAAGVTLPSDARPGAGDSSSEP